MPSVSDIIERHLIKIMSESKGPIEIQRNELAVFFKCAPSQINYVLTTRFSSDRGYVIQSRRGGGGYIKIMKADLDSNEYLRHLLEEKVGNTISKENAQKLVISLYKKKLIDERLKNVIGTAIDDATLSIVGRPVRDNLRAEILKAVIVAALMEYKT